MYVINHHTHVVNKWENSEINRLRLESGKYGVAGFVGEVETVKGVMYEKGFAPVPALEQVRATKLAELSTAFADASENAGIMSSAGFEVDASDVASRAISNLIVSAEATGEEMVKFCDRNNRFHELSLAGLKTILLEIIADSRKKLARKWALRECIHAAQTPEELEAIDIVF